jgi:hypothetical protein
MQRRQFIAGLGSAAAWPVVARAQQGEPMRHIGVLERRKRSRGEGWHLCVHSSTCGLWLDRWPQRAHGRSVERR